MKAPELREMTGSWRPVLRAGEEEAERKRIEAHMATGFPPRPVLQKIGNRPRITPGLPPGGRNSEKNFVALDGRGGIMYL